MSQYKNNATDNTGEQNYANPNQSKQHKSNIFTTWVKVLTRPSIETFRAEIPNASWKLVVFQLGLFLILYYLSLYVAGTIRIIFKLSPPYSFAPVEIFSFILETLTIISGAIVIIFLASGWGGTKTDNSVLITTYLYSIYIIPIAIIASFIGIPPIRSFDIVTYALSCLYIIFLSYYMVRAAYPMRSISAIGFVLLSFILTIFMGYLIALVMYL